LWRTRVEVRAVLDEITVPLKRVLELKVGETVLLDTGPDALIRLDCGAAPLTLGRVGRVGHSVAVRVEQAITQAMRQAMLRSLESRS